MFQNKSLTHQNAGMPNFAENSWFWQEAVAELLAKIKIVPIAGRLPPAPPLPSSRLPFNFPTTLSLTTSSMRRLLDISPESVCTLRAYFENGEITELIIPKHAKKLKNVSTNTTS